MAQEDLASHEVGGQPKPYERCFECFPLDREPKWRCELPAGHGDRHEVHAFGEQWEPLVWLTEERLIFDPMPLWPPPVKVSDRP